MNGSRSVRCVVWRHGETRVENNACRDADILVSDFIVIDTKCRYLGICLYSSVLNLGGFECSIIIVVT